MSSRSRFYLYDSCTATATETININQTFNMNMELIQWFVAFGAAPTTPENILIRCLSGLGILWNYTIVDLDPSLAGERYISCNDIFHVRNGDSIICQYANTDDQNVGVMLAFREAI